MASASQSIVWRIRTGLFETMKSLPLSFFDRHTHGELMSRLSGDVENVSMTVSVTTAMLFIAAAGIAFAAICAPREPAGALDDGHEPTDELKGGRDGGEEHA